MESGKMPERLRPLYADEASEQSLHRCVRRRSGKLGKFGKLPERHQIVCESGNLPVSKRRSFRKKYPFFEVPSFRLHK